MVAAYPTSDRQPLQRGCDMGCVLPYCQTPNRSNTSRDTFHYAGYAFVFPITRQTRAGSQRTNSRPPVSSLLRDRSSRRNSRWSRPFDCSEEHRPRRQRSSNRRVGPDSRESYRSKITMAGGAIQAICPPDCITRFKLCVKRWNETAARRPSRRSISTTGQPSPTAATMIDMRHGTLPTQVEANWQLDFLARWKAKHSIYSEGAIELDGYPVLSPEGGFSEEQIRRINTAILNQVGPNQDSLRHLHQAGRSGNGDSW
jgi:hypothetical protein